MPDLWHVMPGNGPMTFDLRPGDLLCVCFRLPVFGLDADPFKYFVNLARPTLRSDCLEVGDVVLLTSVVNRSGFMRDLPIEGLDLTMHRSVNGRSYRASLISRGFATSKYFELLARGS